MDGDDSAKYHLSVTTLARSDGPRQDLDTLRARVTELESRLGERTSDLARMRADLDGFRIRYRRQVGLLHEELDRLELELAEAELGVIQERVADERVAGVAENVSSPGAAAAARLDSAPKYTTDAIRKLFRDVAKAIHPDLAEDADARDRRHALMVEANRAYALGDEEQLRLILQAWERSPESVNGTDQEAMRQRLERRIAQIEDQLTRLDADRSMMQETSLWKLKAMVDDEASKGRDLITDMVRRLRRDILVATNRLDALRS
jgi:hypothetical protein